LICNVTIYFSLPYHILQIQLKESELARQETLQEIENLTEKLGKAENNMKEKERELKEKNDELNAVSKALADLEKKYQHKV